MSRPNRYIAGGILVLRNADDNHREDHERGEEEQSSDVEEDPAIVLH